MQQIAEGISFDFFDDSAGAKMWSPDFDHLTDSTINACGDCGTGLVEVTSSIAVVNVALGQMLEATPIEN